MTTSLPRQLACSAGVSVVAVVVAGTSGGGSGLRQGKVEDGESHKGWTARARHDVADQNLKQ